MEVALTVVVGRREPFDVAVGKLIRGDLGSGSLAMVAGGGDGSFKGRDLSAVLRRRGLLALGGLRGLVGQVVDGGLNRP